MELEHVFLQHLSAFLALELFFGANLHVSFNIALLYSHPAIFWAINLEIVDEFFKEFVRLEMSR
jgi:hypothetical protein